jgi:hypothetical protein
MTYWNLQDEESPQVDLGSYEGGVLMRVETLKIQTELGNLEQG